MYIAKRLSAGNKNEILNHLLNLSDENKYLRFCYNIKNEMIQKYVDGIDFNSDGCFGVYSEDLELVAFGHCTNYNNEAEVGLSVKEGLQGLGLGDHLMDRMVKFAKANAIENIVMHCLMENKKMSRLAEKHGLKVKLQDGEKFGSMENHELPIFASAESFIMEQIANFDYLTKINAKLQNDMLKTFKNSLKM